MRVVIIEDEAVAAKQLQRMLVEHTPQVEVVATLQSIEESVEYFEQNPAPDLTFMDIHLADGSAFRIFDQVAIESPIVFTTAYDQYALEAFKVNSIDYLLKPISPTALKHAMDKYHKLARGNGVTADLKGLMEMMGKKDKKYKSHFLIPMGDRLMPLAVAEIAYIYLDSKVANIVTLDSRTLAIDKPLDTLAEQLDPKHFYRANRQTIVAHRAIKDISIWMLGKLKLNLCVPTQESIIIPKAKSAEFKAWFSE